MAGYDLLLSEETLVKAARYLHRLREGANPGTRLRDQLIGDQPGTLAPLDLLLALLRTKLPQIFAESAVRGDGSDWNMAELSILGDLSIGMNVTVYDDGRHTNPQIHDEPFPATLIFTPGALLRNGAGRTPADWDEVVRQNRIDPTAYDRLYERRLRPGLAFANHMAAHIGRKAFVTIPGIGCGAFAGPFRGRLGVELERALENLLQSQAAHLPFLAAVYYDPYRESTNRRTRIGAIDFLVRPLQQGNQAKPQLCRPGAYSEEPKEFEGLHLVSFVAWDHVSWPGNDFYAGARQTDDGVKAAATDALKVITGVNGTYDRESAAYMPPKGSNTWGDLVARRKISLKPNRIWLGDQVLDSLDRSGGNHEGLV